MEITRKRLTPPVTTCSAAPNCIPHCTASPPTPATHIEEVALGLAQGAVLVLDEDVVPDVVGPRGQPCRRPLPLELVYRHLHGRHEGGEPVPPCVGREHGRATDHARALCLQHLQGVAAPTALGCGLDDTDIDVRGGGGRLAEKGQPHGTRDGQGLTTGQPLAYGGRVGCAGSLFTRGGEGGGAVRAAD